MLLGGKQEGRATVGADAKTVGLVMRTYCHWPKGVGGLKKLEKLEKKIPKASEWSHFHIGCFFL